jgi:hypothetical protein
VEQDGRKRRLGHPGRRQSNARRLADARAHRIRLETDIRCRGRAKREAGTAKRTHRNANSSFGIRV